MEIESLNSITLGLEAELTQLRNNIKVQSQEYEALLNMKMKLEAEIATYRRLLDGGDFRWIEIMILKNFYCISLYDECSKQSCKKSVGEIDLTFNLTLIFFFRLQDALEEQKTVKTKVMTVTQTLVDGKVVSSSTETKNV